MSPTSETCRDALLCEHLLAASEYLQVISWQSTSSAFFYFFCLGLLNVLAGDGKDVNSFDRCVMLLLKRFYKKKKRKKKNTWKESRITCSTVIHAPNLSDPVKKCPGFENPVSAFRTSLKKNDIRIKHKSVETVHLYKHCLFTTNHIYSHHFLYFGEKKEFKSKSASVPFQ